MSAHEVEPLRRDKALELAARLASLAKRPHKLLSEHDKVTWDGKEWWPPLVKAGYRQMLLRHKQRARELCACALYAANKGAKTDSHMIDCLSKLAQRPPEYN